MSLSTDALVKCPFWLYMAKNTIACEGVVGNTCMLTKFPSAAAKKQHLENHCFLEDGGTCPMAMSLYRKYEE